MKIKLDENLPASLAVELAALGHETDTAPQEGLAGHDDTEIWEATQAAGRFLVTQDLDFSDLRVFEPGTHQGILLVRPREPTRRRLIDRVKQLFATEDVGAWQGCFIVVTDRKVRVRRPNASG